MPYCVNSDMTFRTRRRTIVLLALLVLVAAACSGGDDEGPATTITTEAVTTTFTAPVAVFPLTGLPVDGSPIAARPALVAKVENADANRQTARPQQGIVQADVVFEETVEGSVTRFLLVIHSTDVPRRLGPIRSFRLTDQGVVRPLGGALFSWTGAIEPWVPIARAMATDVGWDAAPSFYRRERARKAPHNLFTSSQELFTLVPPGATPPPPLWPFRAVGEPLPAGGTPVSTVDVVFGNGPGSAPVQWRYDAASKGWLRFQQGTPHVDEDGAQVAPQNLLIQWLQYRDTGFVDNGSSKIIEGVTVGRGEAWLLTEGQLLKGTWSKPDLDTATSFLLADGTPMRLTPGRTWVEMAWAGVAAITPKP